MKKKPLILAAVIIGGVLIYGIAVSSDLSYLKDRISHLFDNRNTSSLIEKGNSYYETGDLDKAAEFYKRAIARSDGRHLLQPRYNLANIYRDKKETEKAIEEYKKAIEVDPKFPFSYQNLAVLYADTGKFSEASELLERLKELKDPDPRVYYNLALIYLAQNKRELTVRNLKDGMKISANDSETDSAIKFLLNKLGVKF